jgi:hypothetical protein
MLFMIPIKTIYEFFGSVWYIVELIQFGFHEVLIQKQKIVRL